MALKRRRRDSKANGSINSDPTQSAAASQLYVEAVPVVTVQALRIDPPEAETSIKAPSVDHSTTIFRNLAIFRFIIFLQLLHTYILYFPHIEVSKSLDAWFIYDWAEKVEEKDKSLSILTCCVFFGVLSALGGVNGVPFSFEVSGSVFLFWFGSRLFTFAYSYNDSYYLLFLLGIISIMSGGGSFFLGSDEVDPQMTEKQKRAHRRKRQLLIQSTEFGVVMLRLQFAVVYIFSALWKVHPDSLQGHVLRGHLLGYDPIEDPRANPDRFWNDMTDFFGSELFQVMGMVGFLMDLAMCLVVLFRRPSTNTTRSFFAWSALYHAVIAQTLGETMGYLLPLSCLAGTLIFHPIGGGTTVGSEKDAAEANLIEWVRRYASKSPKVRATRLQQSVAITWLVVQVIIPLRMPLVSHGSYPFTAKGVRWSWLLGSCTRQTSIYHMGRYMAEQGHSSAVAKKLVPLYLQYLSPECKGNVLLRKDYMPERAAATEDPRTLPIHSFMAGSHLDFIKNYPRFIANVAGRMSLVLHPAVTEACGGPAHVAIYGVDFVKVNNKGAYCRIFDPTVNLALHELARYQQPIWKRIWGMAMDTSTNYEFMLASGIGSMNPRIELHRAAVDLATKRAQRVEYVADRAACLAHRQLALWPNGYPLTIMALETPSNVKLHVTYRVRSKVAEASNVAITAGNQWDILEAPVTSELKSQALYSVTAVSVEISATFSDEAGTQECSCTDTEDILIALIFTS